MGKMAVMVRPGSPLPTLITIPLSHFCEKARWGLDHARVPYVEQRQAPLFHARAVRRAGGKRRVPVLVAGDGVVEDSTKVMSWIDARAEKGRELYPEQRDAREEVLALEDHFDKELGPAVRTAIYFYILPLPKLTIPLLTDGAPLHQRLLTRAIFRPLRKLMRSSMRIDENAARRSIDTVMRVMEAVSDRLADGRRYLHGDRFGAADITFASLTAPAVWVPGYAVPLQPMDQLPAGLQKLVRDVRATRAGEFCLRMYREERRAMNSRR
jgi:glutathione S-transferase